MKTFLHKHWNLTSLGILIFAALWIKWSAVPEGKTTAGKVPAPMEGFLAPEFELTSLDDDTVTLSDLRGKVVLLNFWASWCPPCRSEMPAMQKIYTAFGPDEFVILAVNNLQQDGLAEAQKFIAERNLTFPTLLDTDGQVSAAYQIRSLPTSFFIDQEGLIREIVIGAMPEALLRTRVENLLMEKK